MFGELNAEEIENLLKREIVGRLGCHVDGITYVVPISYAYDGTYLYGRTFEGMKVDMMRKNPRVCFQVDRMRNMANWQSVIAWGEYEELNETKERNHALHILLDRSVPVIASKTVQLSPQWPFPPSEMESIKGLVYRIRLEEKTGRFESNSDDLSFLPEF